MRVVGLNAVWLALAALPMACAEAPEMTPDMASEGQEIGQATQAHSTCWWWGSCGGNGATGATGPQGPAGPAGPKGATGPQGPQGAQGLQGPQGAQGPQGQAGTAGPQGLQGEMGPAGPQGPGGAAGPQGAAGATGPAGAAGATGAQGPAGPEGVAGPEGPEGPEGPPGIVATFYANVDNDQGIIGSTMSGVFRQTPLPATLTVTAEAGTYLLTWNSEVMRTSAGGAANFYARLRDETGSTTVGFMRHGLGVDNGTNGNIPDDGEFFALGDLFPFAGSAVVTLPAGTRTYRLEYALSNSSSALEALRAQHQRISLLRLE